MKKIEDYIRSIPDFPEPGIIFRDITSVLQDADGLQLAIDSMRFFSTYNINCAGVHFCNVSAGHHREAMEWMECICKTIFTDIFFICCKILSKTVHIRQGIHMIVLEQVI